MFEADFRISARVRSNEGQRVFRITEREAPANDAEFLSRVATIYQDVVSPTLQPGDNLAVAVRLDLPPREVERTVHLREDRLFEGEGLSEPTADPFPFLRAFYEPFMQWVKPGDIFTLAFRVQRSYSGKQKP
jgi:hypothetical protein